MKIGTIVKLAGGEREHLRESFARLQENDIHTCQLTAWRMEAITEDIATVVREEAKAADVEITAFWCGWSGDRFWNFSKGPTTLGLVPAQTREARTEDLLRGCDFTSWLGVRDMVTHVGFLPFNSQSEEYIGVLNAVKTIAKRAEELGLRFLFETGQETPITLMRLFSDSGYTNLGVNLDPANLLMYGMANPLDAVRMFGSLIYGVHAKDGTYPSAASPYKLGKETPLGQGDVNYPRLIAALKEVGFDGPLTIEREIKGDEQLTDILAAKNFLLELI